jgi:hypothetical protein
MGLFRHSSRRMEITLICLVALFAVTCHSVSAAESPSIPKRFSAYIGGFTGVSYRVELHGDALRYIRFGRGTTNPKQETITPTPEQWREFRQTLDAMKVWHWRAEYPNHGVCDGTQWSLDIAYHDRILIAHGDNNYPNDTGTPSGVAEPTSAFNRYLAAIQKLLGGRRF